MSTGTGSIRILKRGDGVSGSAVPSTKKKPNDNYLNSGTTGSTVTSDATKHDVPSNPKSLPKKVTQLTNPNTSKKNTSKPKTTPTTNHPTVNTVPLSKKPPKVSSLAEFPELGSPRVQEPINTKKSTFANNTKVVEKRCENNESTQSAFPAVKLIQKASKNKIEKVDTTPSKQNSNKKLSENGKGSKMLPKITETKSDIRIEVDESRSETNLLRLYQEGKITIQEKGLQRVRPRKKVFSPLKKKVLTERLLKWKEANNNNSDTTTTASAGPNSEGVRSDTVLTLGYCSLDELEDEDEYNEIIDNLNDMANKVGPVRRTFIGKDFTDLTQPNDIPVFVQFVDPLDADAATNCWNGLSFGGQRLECHKLISGIDEVSSTNDDDDDTVWHICCRNQFRHHMEAIANDSSIQEVTWHNALTDDDLDDADCLEESMNDIQQEAKKFGSVVSCRVDGRNVIIQYNGGQKVAQKASEALNKLIIGGVKVVASTLDSSIQNELFVVELHNLLTDDDLDDEECLEETLVDVKELASKYGNVVTISTSIKTDGDDDDITKNSPNLILVSYSSLIAAEQCVAGFNSMIIGGKQVVGTIQCNGIPSLKVSTDVEKEDTKVSVDGIMYSGNKIISERFAECKRVPKITNSTNNSTTGNPVREYATLFNDDTVKPLLLEMLSELARLQHRAVLMNNTKVRRRLVIGLREVARGIRSHKVKMIIMANNLDEYGIIDEKLQEIVSLAHTNEVPIFFEFTKKSLGKAIGKTLKMSIIGIQNSDGADQQYKKLTKIASTIATTKLLPTSI